MRFALLRLTLPITLLGLLGSAQARDVVIPAGTLLQCTLDEPNFSSATADVGDPVLCHPRVIQEFGQSAFPRGTYLVGHLESAKDPGHFVGKGNLKLVFDRIGLPNNDVALPGKVVAVHGYHVDKEGKIIGKGHPTRDVVEWMIPPLWPWKILTLPARGPRPALKGETAVTMRLMDDVVIPQNALAQWRRFGQPAADAYEPSSYTSRRNAAAPPAEAPPVLQTVRSQPAVAAPTPALAVLRTSSADTDVSSPAPVPSWHYYGQRSTVSTATTEAAGSQLTLFAVNSGSVYAVSNYWVDNGSLSYTLPGGETGSMSLQDINWETTTKLNSERSVRITLRDRVSDN